MGAGMGCRGTPLRLAEGVHVLLWLLVTDGVLLQVMLGVTEFVHEGVWVAVQRKSKQVKIRNTPHHRPSGWSLRCAWQ